MTTMRCPFFRPASLAAWIAQYRAEPLLPPGGQMIVCLSIAIIYLFGFEIVRFKTASKQFTNVKYTECIIA